MCDSIRPPHAERPCASRASKYPLPPADRPPIRQLPKLPISHKSFKSMGLLFARNPSGSEATSHLTLTPPLLFHIIPHLLLPPYQAADAALVCFLGKNAVAGADHAAQREPGAASMRPIAAQSATPRPRV